MRAPTIVAQELDRIEREIHLVGGSAKRRRGLGLLRDTLRWVLGVYETPVSDRLHARRADEIADDFAAFSVCHRCRGSRVTWWEGIPSPCEACQRQPEGT